MGVELELLGWELLEGGVRASAVGAVGGGVRASGVGAVGVQLELLWWE